MVDIKSYINIKVASCPCENETYLSAQIVYFNYVKNIESAFFISCTFRKYT